MLTLWSKTMSKSGDVGLLRKPKLSTMVCLSIVATIFFLVGLFQTVLSLAFVEASRRNSILIMGPLFMGVGVLLFISVFEMCLTRRRMKQKINLQEEPQIETNFNSDEGNLHMDPPNTILLRADQLPALITLNTQHLHQLNSDQKRLLLAQPALPPVDICSPAPAYYTGNSRIPETATYNPPEDGEPIAVPVLVQETQRDVQEDIRGIDEKATNEIVDDGNNEIGATGISVEDDKLPVMSSKKTDTMQEQENISKEVGIILGTQEMENSANVSQ